jgi:predicted DNA-binding protein (MmcQ/YjbR family)
MDIEILRDYCIRKEGVTESFSFGDDTLVFKVSGKIFALVNLDGESRINLKCDPEYAIELREHFPAVIPGYHMNKKHWNTLILNDTIPDNLTKKLIDHSYNLAGRIRERAPGVPL